MPRLERNEHARETLQRVHAADADTAGHTAPTKHRVSRGPAADHDVDRGAPDAKKKKKKSVGAGVADSFARGRRLVAKKKAGFRNYWANMKSQKWNHMSMMIDEMDANPERYRQIFSKFDVNDDHVLSRDEFASAMLELNNIKPPDDALDAVVPRDGIRKEQLDTVVYKYKEYMNKRGRRIKAARTLVQNFAAHDENKSGALEKEELHRWLRSKKGNALRSTADLDEDMDQILIKLQIGDPVIPITRAEEAEQAWEKVAAARRGRERGCFGC